MGAFLQGRQFLLHAWTDKEIAASFRNQRISMPFLELLAILYAVHTWHKQLADSALELQSDSHTVVQCIQKGFHAKDPFMHHLLRTLLHITITNRIFISCTHLPGVMNIHADALSRAAHRDSLTQTRNLDTMFFSLFSSSSQSQPIGTDQRLPSAPQQQLQQVAIPPFPFSIYP
jgi:ribonuclease HI